VQPWVCALSNVTLDGTEIVLHGALSRNLSLDALASFPLPDPFKVSTSSLALSTPTVCLLKGTTILVTNYQQHIPHFAEGLFATLSGFIGEGMVGNDRQVCSPGSPCSILFHQFSEWPERAAQLDPIHWQSNALSIAQKVLLAPPQGVMGGGVGGVPLRVINPTTHHTLGRG